MVSPETGALAKGNGVSIQIMPLDTTARMRHQRQRAASFQSLRTGRGISEWSIQSLLTCDRYLDLIDVQIIHGEANPSCALLTGVDQDIGNLPFKSPDHRTPPALYRTSARCIASNRMRWSTPPSSSSGP